MKNVFSQVRTITPAMAEEMLKKNTQNRPLNQNYAQLYAKDMKAGNWKLNGEPIIFDDNGNLIDGQHRLMAVVIAGVPVDMLVVYGVGSDSFETIDSGKKRTAADAFSLSGITNPFVMSGIISVYLSIAKSVSTNESLAKRCVTTSGVLDEYNRSPRFWEDIKKDTYAVQATGINLITRVKLGAYMAYLIRDRNHSPQEVIEYFSQVCGRAACVSPSTQTVFNILAKNKMSKSKLPKPYLEYAIIKGWNSFINGKNIKHIPYKEDLPKISFE